MNNYTIFVKYFIIQMEIIQYKLNNKIRIEKITRQLKKYAIHHWKLLNTNWKLHIKNTSVFNANGEDTILQS